MPRYRIAPIEDISRRRRSKLPFETLPFNVQVGLSDAGSGADALAALAATATLADTGSGTDAVSIAAIVTLSDSGSGADAVSVLIGGIPFALLAPIRKRISDFGDIKIRRLRRIAYIDDTNAPTNVGVSDSGSGSDALSVVASVPASDTGSGVDATSLTVTLTLVETGSAADTVSVDTGAGSNITLADAGAGVESITLQVTVGGADTGAGGDSMAVEISVPVSDTGTISEQTLITAILTALIDAGVGSEQASVFDPLAHIAASTFKIAVEQRVYRLKPTKH